MHSSLGLNLRFSSFTLLCRWRLPLSHPALRHAIDEGAAEASIPSEPVKKERKKRKVKDDSPSSLDAHPAVVPGEKKRGRPRKERPEPIPASPAIALPLGTMVLPQAAAAVYSLITEHEMTTLRELLVARNISHKSLLKHLQVLTAFGLIQDELVSEMHLLSIKGRSSGLIRGQIEEVLMGKQIKTERVFEVLSSKYPEEVTGQEAKHQGITMMQIEYVKSLAKMEAKSSTAVESSAMDDDQQLTLQLLRKADLVRVQGYLEQRSIEELRLPPYSRASKREGGVSKISVLQSLVEAAKAGVQLPMERVLSDFFLLPSSGSGNQGWLAISEVCKAVGSCLHVRSTGLSGIVFYESARNVLLRSEPTRSKVEEQEGREEAMSQDLTIQQIRLCYYLGMAGILETDWPGN